MREAHAHILMLGQSLMLPSLQACSSLQQCLDIIRGLCRDAAGKPEAFIRLTSARVFAWPEKRWPTALEIDQVSSGIPVVIKSFDHHQAAANTAAMKLANIHPGDRIGRTGIIDLDTHGAPTGLLHEEAATQAWMAAPPASREQLTQAIMLAMDHLASLGFAEAHDLHTPLILTQLLAELAIKAPLPLRRIDLYPNVTDLEATLALAQSSALSRAFAPRGPLRIAGGKLFADGTLNSKTAALLEPYREPIPGEPLGRLMHTPVEVDQALLLCAHHKLHLAVHAIGDGAVRLLLDRIEHHHAKLASRSSLGELQPIARIEHAELIDPRDVSRFAQLGVTASLQPCHLLTDMEVLHDQLPHRLHCVLPIKRLLASGLTPGAMHRGVVFGSDVPIVRADASDSLTAATLRRRPEMPRESAINPGEAIDPEVAVKCFAISD
jgi:predicted amidohydrolase YtcJ